MSPLVSKEQATEVVLTMLAERCATLQDALARVQADANIEIERYRAAETLDRYQAAAMRTGATSKTWSEQLTVLALGIAGEAGEVADYVKKVVGHGHPLDKDKLAKELGDVLWYVAVLAQHIDLPLSEVARRNIAKLRERYPDGFSSERSINRGEGA